MSYKMLRTFIGKVSVLGYFPYIYIYILLFVILLFLFGGVLSSHPGT